MSNQWKKKYHSRLTNQLSTKRSHAQISCAATYVQRRSHAQSWYESRFGSDAQGACYDLSWTQAIESEIHNLCLHQMADAIPFSFRKPLSKSMTHVCGQCLPIICFEITISFFIFFNFFEVSYSFLENFKKLKWYHYNY